MGEMHKIKIGQAGPCPVAADLFRHIAGEERASAEEIALESYLEDHDYVEAFMEAYPKRREVGMSVFKEYEDKINDVLLAVVEGRFTEARQAILGAVLDVLAKQREESQIEH